MYERIELRWHTKLASISDVCRLLDFAAEGGRSLGDAVLMMSPLAGASYDSVPLWTDIVVNSTLQYGVAVGMMRRAIQTILLVVFCHRQGCLGQRNRQCAQKSWNTASHCSLISSVYRPLPPSLSSSSAGGSGYSSKLPASPSHSTRGTMGPFRLR